MAQTSIANGYELLIIGGSAGSLEIVLQLLPALHATSLAIVIVMHRKSGESILVNLLNGKTTWPVKEVEEKEPVQRKTVYIAPSDYHLLFEKDKTFSLDYSEKVHYSRPSIDVSFESAAEVYGTSVIAVLLSGANADGAAGLQCIKKAGGITIVQDPHEASVSYMPQQAIETSKIDYIADTPSMVAIINRLAGSL